MAEIRNQIWVQGQLYGLPQRFTFISAEADILLPGQTVEEIDRRAVDGVAFRRMGRKASPFRIDTVKDVRNGFEAMLYRRDWNNARGRIITFYDAFGVYLEPLVVLNVVPGKLQALKAGSVVGGTLNGEAGALLNCQWWVRYPYGYV